ncbi:MAG: fructose-1,6-bisphosphatase [Bacteroidales bacterium]|nr:fructose-1,6-bisphosphatase [Bacteroidales bacterium]
MTMENYNLTETDLRYLRLLAKSFPSIASASTEIINLEAILNLPKGTEHFLSDIHGEYEAFQHVLKNASGSIKRKVNDVFGTSLREAEKRDLCTLIYYPKEKLRIIKKEETNINEWYMITLNQLIKVCQVVSSKYTRSKVRKALPKEFAYIIEELLHETHEGNKRGYFNQIISTIISTKRADEFIIAMCNLIQQLAIDSLHLVGDIYDRGQGAHIILDTLCTYHNVDVQWGNHDLLWMGAFAGNNASIATVVRQSLRYATLETLEDGYGINMLPLATFAMEVYKDDPVEVYAPKMKLVPDRYSQKEQRLIAQMHKAITIIQWKCEAELIDRNTEYNMADRKLLHLIDFERGVVKIDDVEYELLDKSFPTINPSDPYTLTDEEQNIINLLHASFVNSEKLKKHIYFLLQKGSFYLARNNNLMFHASIPLNEDGTFKKVKIMDEYYSGKNLLDRLDSLVQLACRKSSEISEEKQYAIDYMWYLWCGADSPSFDKAKMATFERYLTTDKEVQKETKGYYYQLQNDENVCINILKEFGIEGEGCHIINGHVPVKIKKGENPVRANGKLLVIDGGFSKAYHSETGIAGYTLVYNSIGMQLVQHEPFESTQKAIEEGLDIISNTVLSEHNTERLLVKDTDKGKEMKRNIEELHKLLIAYRTALIRENS